MEKAVTDHKSDKPLKKPSLKNFNYLLSPSKERKDQHPMKRLNAIRRRSVFDTHINTPNEEPEETETLRLQSSKTLGETERKCDDEDYEYFDIFLDEKHCHALPTYFNDKSLCVISPENKIRILFQSLLSKT